MMTHDLFISFSFKDEQVAKIVYSTLINHDIKVFWCHDIPAGEDYGKLIGTAIKESSIFLLLFSAASDNALAVRNETSIAFNNKKLIIPMRLENIMPDNLIYFVGTNLFLDAFPPPVEQYLPKLIDDIKRILSKEEAIKPTDRPTEIMQLLNKYIKELDLNYPSFDPNEERITIGEHSLRVLRLFDKYRIFNKMIFPENIIGRDKFMVVLALHDIGMAKVAKRDDIKLKYGIAQQTIQWLIKRPDFKGKYGFNAQEEQIALALVSNEPMWRYLNNRFDEITCAEQIMNMAFNAGIEIDGPAFHYFFQLVMIYYLCDAGSYSTLVGGDRKYDFISFDDSNKEIKLVGAEKEKIDTLEVVINKITKGAILFTSSAWKRIKENYMNDFAHSKIAQMKQGDIPKGRYYQYRYNSKLRIFEISPRGSTKIPALYDPNY